MLVAERISKKFGKKIALHPTSFTLEKGITGLLGPNGAGKTTLLRILSTYHRPTEGKLELNGVGWEQKNIENIRSKIGYLPQNPGLFPVLKVREYLEYMGILKGMSGKNLASRIQEVLQEVHLEERTHDHIRSLSGGMKQRLGIAQAIIHDPDLLLVDEPTSGLDPEERIRFRNLIKRLATERIVLISTHITEDISMTCDKVYLMRDGHVHVHENVQSVIAYADKRVWSVQADATDYEKLKSNPNIVITNLIESAHHNYDVRVIAKERPASNAESVTPLLEEGYMVWLHEN